MKASAEQLYGLSFESWWQKDPGPISDQVLEVWKSYGGPVGERAADRLKQLVFVVRDSDGRIGGLSTAFRTYVPQLRNHFYAIRLMLVPDCRIPGLTSRLMVNTRDLLESIHAPEGDDATIGVVTLVENPRLKEMRNEAVWPASRMVYVGNSKEGHHLRVYYFRGARIAP